MSGKCIKKHRFISKGLDQGRLRRAMENASVFLRICEILKDFVHL